jgi:hypothetical protein
MILATALATLLPALSPATLPAGDALPYADLAQSFLESKGKADASRRDTSIDKIIEDGFLEASVGVFQVWAPIDELADRETAKNFRDLCTALCNAQIGWVEWLGEGATNGDELLENFTTYRDWIETWEPSSITAAGEKAQRDVRDIFDFSEKVQASDEFTKEWMRHKRVLSDGTVQPRAIKLVLMPSRKGFVEFIAYGGHQFPKDKSNFWRPDMQNWTHFTLNDYMIMALEYASPKSGPGEYEPAYDMNTKSETGMQEQIVQMGLNQMLDHQHGDALPSSLASGLAINLVTQMYDHCTSRIDGDIRGKVTAKRSQFVRGGLSHGGILPPNSAESRWRANYGSKFYAPILKRVQSSGYKEAKSKKIKLPKYNSFLLESDGGVGTHLTHAPLLGPSGGPTEKVDDSVYGDYLEFTRAYRCAFLHWLQHYGLKKEKDSKAAFGVFLSKLSGGLEGPNIADIAEEIYGAPLSDGEASKKTLEGRFLKWISKHKAQKASKKKRS